MVVKIKDLQDLELNANGRKFKAHTLYAEKNGDEVLLVYWICINKKRVDWTQQKLLQLLLVRLDIPSRENNIKSSLKLAQEFIRDISFEIPPEQQEYLFGK